ncbi:MAG: isoprenylcysteine carboxylmethyltransferase family protein, partial [Candidatus Binatia bacterium]
VTAVRVVLGVLLQPALLGIALFYPPGTFAWQRAWVIMAVFFAATVMSLAALARARPDLLAERFKPPLQRGQPAADKVAVLGFIAAFAGAIRFIPFDVFQLHWLPPPGQGAAYAGLVLVIVGWWIVTAAMLANAFAVPVVKHQADRHQHVIDRGPYAIVRHPMYSGISLVMLGMPLWLGSSAGVLVALVPIAVLAVRIGIEEAFLRRELAGYADYAARVRARLVPFVW